MLCWYFLCVIQMLLEDIYYINVLECLIIEITESCKIQDKCVVVFLGPYRFYIQNHKFQWFVRLFILFFFHLKCNHQEQFEDAIKWNRWTWTQLIYCKVKRLRSILTSIFSFIDCVITTCCAYFFFMKINSVGFELSLCVLHIVSINYD